MPKYTTSICYFFRENGKRYEAGEEVELTEEQAREHNRVHPGLLKAERITTKGNPSKVVRTSRKRK